MRNFLDRLREPSSYSAMGVLLGVVGINVDDALLTMVSTAGAAISGIVGFFMAEKGQGSK